MQRVSTLAKQVVAAAPERFDGDAWQKLMVKKAPVGTKCNKKQVKSYGFVKRDVAKCSHEEFCKIWQEPHMPNVVKSGLNPKQYIVNLFEEKTGAEALPFDGCAQMWFDSPEHLKQRFKATPAFKDAFSEASGGMAQLLTREYVFIDGPREGTKVTYLVKPKDGVSRQAVYDHYFSKNAHQVKDAFAKALGPDALRKVRYSMSVVMDPQKSEYAGVVELWTPDQKSMEACEAAVPSDAAWEGLREAGIPTFVGKEVVGI